MSDHNPSDISFPQPLSLNGRLYWRRSALEAYKRALVRQAMGAANDPEPVHDSIEVFVTAAEVARELGVGRRTIGRRIAAEPAMHSAKIAEAV